MEITVSTKSKKWTDFENKEWNLADIEHYGQALDWSKPLFVITAKINNKVVGVSRMDIEVGVAHIITLIVSKTQRGSGIGRAIIRKAESIALENKAHKIYLQTGKNWDAVKFYDKLGYKITSHLPNHYFHIDFVEMTKFL